MNLMKKPEFRPNPRQQGASRGCVVAPAARLLAGSRVSLLLPLLPCPCGRPGCLTTKMREEGREPHPRSHFAFATSPRTPVGFGAASKANA